MRFVLMLAIACLGLVYMSQRSGGVAAGPATVRSMLPGGGASSMTPEFRGIIDSFDVRSGAQRRGGGATLGVGSQPGPRAFADLGPRRAVARVKRDVRRALRRLPPRSSQRVRVARFQGVAVSGDRAVAVVDIRRRVRPRPGAGWRDIPIERRNVVLQRKGREWRFVGGLLEG